MTKTLFAVFFVFLGIAVLSDRARAADAALPQEYYFSQDGARFAFRETGIQDGSGWYYHNEYWIDLVRDSWLQRPNRFLYEAEDAQPSSGELAEFRAGYADQNAALGITLEGREIYRRDDDFPDLPGRQASQLRLTGVADLLLTLEPLALPAPHCSEQAFGFRLSEGKQLLYADEKIPKSRGCPVAYTIERLVAPPKQFAQPPYLVAIIGFYRRGFEGHDRRHIAIPIKLN